MINLMTSVTVIIAFKMNGEDKIIPKITRSK